MNSSSIDEIENLLKDYIPLVSKYGADGKSVERMRAVLKLAGSPQEKLKIIHIAGTSGKTSTAYYIAAMLEGLHVKVGLTVSPHIYSVTERVQINNKPIASDKFLKELKMFLKIIEEVKEKPSYFELTMAFALWEFYRQGVEYAVVETGMGGLLDASNVLNNEYKVCVITDIGFDHVHVLGDTLEEIATQKAGIVHENNKVFMHEQSEEVMSVVFSRVEAKNASLKIIRISDDKIATLSQLSDFQTRNYNLAKEVAEYVSKRDGLTLIKFFKPKQVKIPGRMETIKLKDSSVLILDGAHNKQKMEAFVCSYKSIYGDEKAIVLLALKNGKDYIEIIDSLLSISKKIIITQFMSSDNLPASSIDTSILKKYLDNTNIESEAVPNLSSATQKLISEKGIKIITGSFYLISQTKKMINYSL